MPKGKKSEAQKLAELAARRKKEAEDVAYVLAHDRRLTPVEVEGLAKYLATTNMGFDDDLDIDVERGLFLIKSWGGTADEIPLNDLDLIGWRVKSNALNRVAGEADIEPEYRSWARDKKLKNGTLHYVAETWSDMAGWMRYLAEHPKEN